MLLTAVAMYECIMINIALQSVVSLSAPVVNLVLLMLMANQRVNVKKMSLVQHVKVNG